MMNCPIVCLFSWLIARSASDRDKNVTRTSPLGLPSGVYCICKHSGVHHWLTCSVEHRIVIYWNFTFQMKTFENVFVYAIYVDDLYVLHTRNVLTFGM
jgi:hypothetical protein